MSLIIRRWRRHALVNAAPAQYSFKSTTFNDGVSNETITFGDVLDKEGSDAFSLLCWAKVPSGADGVMIGKQLHTGFLPGYQLRIFTGGTFLFQIHGNAAGDFLQANSATAIYDDATWRLFASTYNGSGAVSGASLYVDGSPIAIGATQDTLVNTSLNSANFAFGSRNGGNLLLDAKLLAPIVANKELSAAEVLETYNGGWPKDPTTLSYYAASVAAAGGDTWRLGDSPDNATTVFSIPGSNDGTLVNMDASNYTTDVPIAA